MAIRFALMESTFGYFEATRQYIDNHGKPLEFYSDKDSIFRVNRATATTGPGQTRFGRAHYELNIEGICANTPAAKGRVERAHLTLQDRLIKELRLGGICHPEPGQNCTPVYRHSHLGGVSPEKLERGGTCPPKAENSTFRCRPALIPLDCVWPCEILVGRNSLFGIPTFLSYMPTNLTRMCM